jgi:hypothetical protein
MASGTIPLGKWEIPIFPVGIFSGKMGRWENCERLNTANHCVPTTTVGWQLFTSFPDGAVLYHTQDRSIFYNLTSHLDGAVRVSCSGLSLTSHLDGAVRVSYSGLTSFNVPLRRSSSWVILRTNHRLTSHSDGAVRVSYSGLTIV